jgi:probable rRNA maturation factor
VIYLRNSTRKRALPLRRLERSARRLLAATGRPNASLSLTFVGDAAMRRINREHRGKDRTTDVLSFPLYEPFAVPKRALAGQAELLIGDIIISVDAAARQAAA